MSFPIKDGTDKLNVVEAIQKSGSPNIKVAITDIDGVLRGKYIHKEKFLSAMDGGLGVCNVVFGWDSHDVCYDNTRFTGWHSGYPDAVVRLDPSTYRIIPWDNNTPFLLGDFVHSDGCPLEICPRQLLKRVLQKSEKMGYRSLCGLEFEWFNFKETPQSWAEKKYSSPEPITPGMFGYSILRSSLNQPFFSTLMDQLHRFNIPLEGIHTETGPGVFEAALLYSDALEAADRGVLFKTGVKEIGYRFGIMPSFMAKWNVKLPGCSGHLHQSLWDPEKKRNLFYDEADKARMSPLFKSFVSGQMHCLPEILPLFVPNVNSYKRLVEGFWAPTKVTWGIDNRTTALRVIPGSPKSTRLETRVPGSDINPYLAIAAALASGLYGIEKKLTLSESPVIGNAYDAKGAVQLPNTLQGATEILSKSSLAKELFGEVFVEHFVKTREWEWRQFRQSVTGWELERYFEII